METGIQKTTSTELAQAQTGLIYLLKSQPTLPQNLQNIVNSKKELAIIDKGEASIAHYKQPNQREFLLLTLKNSLATELQLINASNTLTPYQLDLICQKIIEEDEFKFLSPSEFREAFSRGVRGNYEKNYGTIDIQRIYAWIRGYIEERFAAIDEFREKEANSYKEDSKIQYASKGLKEILDKLKQNLDIWKKPVEIVKRERTPAEKELDGYIAEFDKLAKQKDADTSSMIVLVNYKGEMLSRDQYFNARFKENHPELETDE